MSASPNLSPSQLIGAARQIAMRVATASALYVDSNALQAIDELVEERIPDLQVLADRGKFDFLRWQRHVEHICNQTVAGLQEAGIREVATKQDLIALLPMTARVYPYD